eukprot:8473189-Pyramimonas_sp.AAC.1
MGFISQLEGHVAHALLAHLATLSGWEKHPMTEIPQLWHVMAGTWDGMDETFRKNIVSIIDKSEGFQLVHMARALLSGVRLQGYYGGRGYYGDKGYDGGRGYDDGK